MAFKYYLNMEQLMLDAAKEHISNMSDNNCKEDTFLDYDKISNNLKNGFIVITMLISFIESFLNSIIYLYIDEKADLRKDINEKMKIIFDYYEKDKRCITKTTLWMKYKETANVRNELIHFKKCFMAYGGDIPDVNIGGKLIGEYFIKSEMMKIYDNHKMLAKMIANELGLQVFNDVKIFQCDEAVEPCHYVLRK